MQMHMPVCAFVVYMPECTFVVCNPGRQVFSPQSQNDKHKGIIPLSSSIRLCMILESANILAQASSLHTVPTSMITCNTQSSSAAPVTYITA